MRAQTALALVIVNVGFGWLGVTTASADGTGVGPPLFSQCYTVTVSPPTPIKPSVTICQP